MNVDWSCSNLNKIQYAFLNVAFQARDAGCSNSDRATSSGFWTKCSGAINHQLAHHLYPAVLPHYYPTITPYMLHVWIGDQHNSGQPKIKGTEANQQAIS